MKVKRYAINYYCKANDTYLTLGWFDTEAKASKYAQELVRDYPDVIGDYFIIWDMR